MISKLNASTQEWVEAQMRDAPALQPTQLERITILLGGALSVGCQDDGGVSPVDGQG